MDVDRTEEQSLLLSREYLSFVALALIVSGGAMQTEANQNCRQVNPRAPQASRRHPPRVFLCFCLLSLFCNSID